MSIKTFQPPLGGCVLKLCNSIFDKIFHFQPPLGGCVLKRRVVAKHGCREDTAAFRRLCVETMPPAGQVSAAAPAAFRRLCVETRFWLCRIKKQRQPPLGGCVLKQGDVVPAEVVEVTSRL